MSYVEERREGEIDIAMPDESYAKAFDRLSTTKAISILSNIWAKGDIQRMQLGLNMGSGNGLNYPFLIDFVHDGLALRVSYKALGREHIVKCIVADVERKQGVGQKLKDFMGGNK